MKPDISILIATRGRRDWFRRSMNALLGNASERDKIEVIVKLDDDDTTNYYDALDKDFHVVISPRGEGYNDFHRFYNEMCEVACGDFFVIATDDMIVTTSGWDVILRNAPILKHGVALLRYHTILGESGATRPDVFAITRKVYELTGCYAAHPHADGYVMEMMKDVCMIDLPISAYHHRFDFTGDRSLDDSVYHGGPIFKELPPHFLGGCGQQWEKKRDADRDMLKEYIRNASTDP